MGKRFISDLDISQLLALDKLPLNELLESFEPVTGPDVTHAFELFGLMWTYPDAEEPQSHKPHALLASGVHSGGYVKVGEVFRQSTAMTWLIADAILQMDSGTFDWVVGSATSATPLAEAVAHLSKTRHIRLEKGPNGEQNWPEGQALITVNTTGLRVEEMVTTLVSSEKARQTVESLNFGTFFLPTVRTVARQLPRDASEKEECSPMFGSRVVSLATYWFDRYDIRNGKTCRFCQAGSPALRPMDLANQEYFFGRRL